MTEDKNFLERLEHLTLITKGRLDRTTHCPAIRNIRQEFLKNTDDLLSQMAQWARSETETLLRQINQENAQEVTETIHAIIVMERTFLYRFMEARMSVHDLTDNMLIQISCTPRKHGWNKPALIPRTRNLRVERSHQKPKSLLLSEKRLL